MKKVYFILSLILIVTSNGLGQSADRPKVGLVLSGGSAHGLSHIGVIRYLEDQGIPIDYVTGTSMGAVVGGLYAIGYNSEEIESIARGVDWDNVLSNYTRLNEVAPSEKRYHNRFALNFFIQDGEINLPRGFINSQKLDLLISRLYSGANFMDDFDDLPRPFRCMAVNIENGAIKEFDKGYLGQAVRASMAIPSVFSPVEIDGQLYVDGGLIRNLPAEENIALGADILIGVYVGGVLEDKNELKSLLDVLSQSAFMMGILDSKEQRKYLDVLVEPDVKDQRSFAFKELDYFIQEGYKAATLHEDAITAIKAKIGINDYEPISRLLTPTALKLSDINFPMTSTPFDQLARFKFGNIRPTIYRIDDIEAAIDRIYGTKHFENISYNMDLSDNGRKKMSILAKPKKGAELYANLNFFKSSGAGLILHSELRNVLSKPSVLSATARISDRLAANINYYYRLGQKKDFLFTFNAAMIGQDFYLYRDNVLLEDYISKEALVNIGVAQEPNNSLWYGIRTGIQQLGLKTTRSISDGLQDYDRTNFQIKSYISYNSLDQPEFANQGFLLALEARHQVLLSQNINGGENILEYIPIDKDYTIITATAKAVYTPLPRFTTNLSLQLGWKSAQSLLDNYRIGGIESRKNISLPFIGLNTDQFHFESLVKAGLDLRVTILPSLYISILADHIRGDRTFIYSEDLSNINNQSLWGYGAKLSLDTPLGPVQFAHGKNTLTNDWNTNISLGYTFF